MNEIQNISKVKDFLTRYNIEKSIVGSPANLIEQDLIKGMNQEEVLEKYNSGEYFEKAKYFKREGTQGNYKYYYTEDQYKKEKGNKKSENEEKILGTTHSVLLSSLFPLI